MRAKKGQSGHKILIAYASGFGTTQGVAEALRRWSKDICAEIVAIKGGGSRKSF